MNKGTKGATPKPTHKGQIADRVSQTQTVNTANASQNACGARSVPQGQVAVSPCASSMWQLRSAAPEAAPAGLAPDGTGKPLRHAQRMMGRVVVQLVPGDGKQQVLVDVKLTRAGKAGFGVGFGPGARRRRREHKYREGQGMRGRARGGRWRRRVTASRGVCVWGGG